MRADTQTIEALARLSQTKDGEALLSFLDAELRSTLDNLVAAPEQMISKLQGRAQLLKEISKLLRDSPQLVKR